MKEWMKWLIPVSLILGALARSMPKKPLRIERGDPPYLSGTIRSDWRPGRAVFSAVFLPEDQRWLLSDWFGTVLLAAGISPLTRDVGTIMPIAILPTPQQMSALKPILGWQVELRPIGYVSTNTVQAMVVEPRVIAKFAPETGGPELFASTQLLLDDGWSWLLFEQFKRPFVMVFARPGRDVEEAGAAVDEALKSGQLQLVSNAKVFHGIVGYYDGKKTRFNFMDTIYEDLNLFSRG